MNEANVLCIKFDFGLPLEDIFPPNSVHPRLQILFGQTILALKRSDVPLKQLIEKSEVSLIETFDLKEALIDGKIQFDADICPYNYLWLIRHFFGLLPLPLFPRFTDGQQYNWEYLATLCKISYCRPDSQLQSEISWWIHKLPKANVLLIYSFFNFVRKICLRKNSKKKMEKNSVVAVTTFFSASLFARPYRPGFVDSLYYPLMYYLIAYWSKIKKEEKEVNRFNLITIWENEENNLAKESCGKLANDFLVDCRCQRSTWSKKEVACQVENNCVKEVLDEAKMSFIEKNKNIFVGEESKSMLSSKFSFLEKDNLRPTLEKFKTESFNEDEPLYEEIFEEKVSNLSTREKMKVDILESEQQELKENTSNTENRHEIRFSCVDDVSVEKSSEEKLQNAETSETEIYKEKEKKLSKTFFRNKMFKSNLSLINVISKVKSKQDVIKSRSGSKFDFKYNLLKNHSATKVQSLHTPQGVTESPNIKYKKLLTI